MRHKFLAVGILAFASLPVFASNIAWNQAHFEEEISYSGELDHWLCCFFYDEILGGSPGFAIRLYFSNDYDMDGHLTGVSVEPDSSGGAAYGMNIAAMTTGETVSEETVRGDHSYFYANWIDSESGYDGASPETSSVYIHNNEEVYLGFVTDTAPNKYYYGWFSLIFDGADVRVGQSAMELSGGPIIIQPRSVPEPGVAMLLCVGVAAFLLRRRVEKRLA